MTEDTPVKTGVVEWLDGSTACSSVRMGADLRRSAGQGESRRLGDLFGRSGHEGLPRKGGRTHKSRGKSALGIL